MMINALRLRALADNCRRFTPIARNEVSRRALIDMAREYDARAAEIEALARAERVPEPNRILVV